MDLVTLGELILDMFPAELGRRHAEVSAFRPVPGGAPANVAVAAARLGAAAAFIGKVGEDPFGHFMADVLAREGVETRGMRFDPDARTTMNLMAQPDANSYDCLFYRNPGADTRLRPDELDVALLAETRAFHFGSLSLTDEPARSATAEAVKIARSAGALISYDVNYRPTLWKSPGEARDQALALIPSADLVKVNEAELALLAGEGELATASTALLALGPSLCVVTLGLAGSYFRIAAGGGHIPGFAVKTVDATGCGDAFIAGLLWQLAPNSGGKGDWRGRLTLEQLRPALRYANAVGALTATKQGVIPSLPTAAEVEAFLAVR
ncbi:MAG: PfkB family carbohydrate kinase [Chloroflexi bacterium]|nr:PfkB family carbohydrate kinase [Chloroflexota bacterium]